ncbi:shikimate kinase [Mangrovitalea sediminis]|uniref:shikimate kinase n=1 Tax=Mangrovitalea sediminis TaxID=1982043 RepID=UPI001D0CFD87|nr:shikimate kinase [Mangrovitalea sediminis]
MPQQQPNDNLILIGMPGAGKSTIGVLLAKRLGLGFVDTDVLIQTREGRTLQDIVNSDGPAALRQIEEQVLADLKVTRTVIATGGSAVYSAKAMSALAESGIIVNLHVPLPVLEQRISNHDTRGLVRQPGQSIADLYQERVPLYARYADISIEVDNERPDQVVEQIVGAISR